MKLSRNSCEEYANEIRSLCELASKDMSSSLMALPWDGATLAELEFNRDFAIAQIFQSMEKYGTASASVAADFFEAIASFAGKRAQAVGAEIADLTDFEQINKSVRWAAESLFPASGVPDVEAFATRCGGIVERVVMKAANNTIIESAKANKAKVKWARICTDPKPCDDCLRLESYGYTWDEGEFFEIHDHCHCAFVPGFGDNPTIEATGNVYPELDDLF